MIYSMKFELNETMQLFDVLFVLLIMIYSIKLYYKKYYILFLIKTVTLLL